MPGRTVEKRNRFRMFGAVAAVTGATLVLAACGSTKDDTADSAGSGEATGPARSA